MSEGENNAVELAEEVESLKSAKGSLQIQVIVLAVGFFVCAIICAINYINIGVMQSNCNNCVKQAAEK